VWWPIPTGPILRPISWAVVAATVGAEMSIVFNNAPSCPNIVRPERMGWLSGSWLGLAIAGLIALFIVLAVSMPAMFGLAANNDHPLFGLDAQSQ